METDLARGFAAWLGQSRLSPGEKALIGVSGGRDSVVLLDLLVSAGFRHLIICHLNHQLRGEASDADAAFVKALARKHGLKYEARAVDVAAMAAKKKLSVETAAREARREFFREAARKHRCRALFLAHHAGDQAETVLMNLFRGAGLAGVAGMTHVSEDALDGLTLVRPLLDVPRVMIDDHARERELTHREDASNASLEHTRNRVRHELLPLASDIFKRDAGPLLARFADIARGDDGCLDDLARQWLARPDVTRADGSLKVPDELKSAHPAIVARVISLWLAESHRIQAQHREIAAALAMLMPGGPAKTNLRGGRHLRRKTGCLRVS